MTENCDPRPLTPQQQEERRQRARRAQDLDRIAVEAACSDLSIVARAVTDIHDHLADTVKDAVKDAVREGITAALTSPEMWSAAMLGMRKSTERAAGPLVMGSLWSLTKKLLGFALLGAIIHTWGGWDALVAFWKSVIHK